MALQHTVGLNLRAYRRVGRAEPDRARGTAWRPLDVRERARTRHAQPHAADSRTARGPYRSGPDGPVRSAVLSGQRVIPRGRCRDRLLGRTPGAATGLRNEAVPSILERARRALLVRDEPAELTTFLAPAFGRVEAAQSDGSGSSQPATDVASQLAALAALHQEGALDADEFSGREARGARRDLTPAPGFQPRRPEDGPPRVFTLAASIGRGNSLASRVAAVVVGGLLLFGILSAETAGTASRNCGTIGSDQSDTGLYNVTAQRLSCRKARRILTRWYNDASAPDSGPRGWRCSTRSHGRYVTRTGCRHGHFRIAWTQYSA
jgi:hypothetical protein